ncbi:response regulator [Archangium violaceum]|uniref:hybrid sensor histidine kinase/response regulator n=1 Tax=Archangium violaceum TaxID=83451 RepID=UPI00193B4390|nr:ATP-binding protein [Archangium violaceum]QRK08191.1 response regulator [Archangium violaceum]
MIREGTVFRLSDLAELGALALRRQVNDLFALLELPSVWQGRGPGEIAASGLDVLVDLLRLDVALLRLHGPEGGLEHRFPAELDREALLSVGRGASPDSPVSFELPRPNTVGRTTVRVVAVPTLGGSGTVIAGSWRANFPTAHERHLLQTIANQVALAMQSSREARARRELAEERVRLARVNAVLATLHAVSDELSRTHTFPRVADVILSRGLAALGAHAGLMFLADESGTELRLLRGVGYSVTLLRGYQRIPANADLPIAEAFRRKHGIFRGDAPPPSRGFAAVPLVVDEQCLGVLCFGFSEPQRFVDDERAFIHAIAQQAAQACERARLLEAERCARLMAEARQQRADLLSETSAILGSSLDLGMSLTRVAHLLVPQVADWVVMRVEQRSPSGADETKTVAVHRDPGRVGMACALARSLLATGDAPLSCVTNNSVLAPISVRDRALGAIVLGSEDTGCYDNESLELVEELGLRVGMALDNARLYQEAREADRRKDEFLAMLGHELRNPLAPMITALHLMRMKEGGGFERERTIISRQVEHLVRLVDDLLDVSRITRGKIQLKRSRIDLMTVVVKAVEMASPLLEQRSHHLELPQAREPLFVDGDPARLAQVLANLLNNAAKYTDPGGRIVVTAACEGGQAVLRVRDNGAGIAPDVLPKVFDMFVQEGRSLDRSQGGLGLGLAIVRSLIELHGGTVSAWSEGLGRGSEFVVRLPLVAPLTPAADEHRSPSPEASVQGAASSVRLLVVDDNRDAAELLTELLDSRGYVARMAFDGPAGLAEACAFRPHIALLDVGLPVMDGYELASRIRQEPTLVGIKLVAVTGYGQDSDCRRALAAGFDVHMVKPIDPGQLLRVIRDLVGVPEDASHVSPEGGEGMSQ